jgi:hypothetical protein
VTGFGRLSRFSYGQLRRLPSNPHRLLERIKARLEPRHGLQDVQDQARGALLTQQTAQTVLELLEAPAPAPVHAGLLSAARLLAASTAHLGDDYLGHSGIVLQLDTGPGAEAIINAKSEALMADNTFGGLETYLAAGIVDSPTALPRGFPRS